MLNGMMQEIERQEIEEKKMQNQKPSPNKFLIRNFINL